MKIHALTYSTSCLLRFSLGLIIIGAFLTLPARGEVATWFQCPDDDNNGIRLSPAVIKGKRFFVDGEYFPIKGIAYYPRPNAGTLSISDSVDLFTDEFRDLWMADIENFKALGVNAIRIYGVDPSKNHDSFMCALQAAGIYVMIGLQADCLRCNIGRRGADEGEGCYPPELKTRGQFIINTFSKYNNTLAFSAGNEVGLWAIGQVTELNAPCQKKFLRDMRSYVRSCSNVLNSILPRAVPIGVVTADRDRELNALYYNCRTDPNDDLENAEWYGLNTYQHCDPNARTVEDLVGYIKLRQDFSSYNIPNPVVLAEIGCMNRLFPWIGLFLGQRNWLQIDAIYNHSDYVEEFAGAMVFEYSTEKKKADESWDATPFPYNQFASLNFGIGYYLPENCNHMDIPCSEYRKYPEFDLLANKLKATSGASNLVPRMEDYEASDNPELPECPLEIEPLSAFTWPSDEDVGMPCYVVATGAPTAPPTLAPTSTPSWTPSHAPSLEPTLIPSDAPSLVPSHASTQASSSSSSFSIMQAPSTAPTEGSSRPPAVNTTTDETVPNSIISSNTDSSSGTDISSAGDDALRITTTATTASVIAMLIAGLYCY